MVGITQSLRAELVDALGRWYPATRIEELGSAQELLDAGHAVFPDAAIIVDCPDDDAVMVAEIQRIRRARPHGTIVALHRADDAGHACVAIQAGANGCLSRGIDPAEIAEAVHLLMSRPAPSRSHDAQGHGHQRLLVDLDTLATASLFDRLPVASYVIQGSGYAAVNHAAAELFHYSIGDMMRLRYWDVIAPAWRGDIRRRVMHWLRGEPLVTHGETPIVTRNGEHRWVEAHHRKIEFRGAPALLVVLTDVTERRFRTEGRHVAAQPKAASAAAPDRSASAAGPAAEHAEAYAWLTQRQAEVLGLIGQGRTNKQIARMLGITEGTVKLHVHALMRAFRVQNRTMLALVAWERQPA
ncbi:MAG: LuxR C-terminal-related transcriptional regulator [Alphaproteobacteria bacterium]|nr:LuxR C-terminal-related transcriptional regulator [Alphaproteobacteria bacterium]